jgi:hypothetical protein
MRKGLFFIFFILSCGKEQDLRETTVYFNFTNKAAEKSINVNPGRYVLFAHDEDRLEKARVIVEGGSTQMTLPNGNWKFSVLGFEGSVAGNTSWPIFVTITPQAGTLFCGATETISLEGTPKQIQLNVYKFSNASALNPCGSSSNAPATAIVANAQSGSAPNTTLCLKWSLPFGDRDSNGDIGGVVFKTELLTTDGGNRIHLPSNKNLLNLTVPYYLNLEVYSSSSNVCDPAEPSLLQAVVEFDGDYNKSPVINDKITQGTSYLHYIIFSYVNSGGSLVALTSVELSINI